MIEMLLLNMIRDLRASGLCPSGCKQSLRPSGPLDRLPAALARRASAFHLYDKYHNLINQCRKYCNMERMQQ